MALNDNDRNFLAQAALVCASDTRGQRWPHQDAVAEMMRIECDQLLEKQKLPPPACQSVTSFMPEVAARA